MADDRPTPLPLEVTATRPPAPGSRTSTIAVVVVLVLLFACCSCVVVFTALGARYGEQMGSRALDALVPQFWGGVPRLYWTGNGRYAVAQTSDVRITSSAGRMRESASVCVWDSRTAESVTLEDYRIVAVESAAPRLWLVRDEPERPSDSLDGAAFGCDQACDAVDEPVSDLLVWDVSVPGSSPESPTDFEWAPWPGSGGWSAQCIVDPRRGSNPSSVAFQRDGQRIEARLPTDTVTFHPLGWSPSGRHFAVIALTPLDEFDHFADWTSLERARAKSTARVVVLSAETGEAVANEGLGSIDVTADLRHRAMWSEHEGVLFTLPQDPVDEDYDEGYEERWVERSIIAIRPDDDPAVRDLYDADDGGRAWPFGDAYIDFAGSCASGAYVSTSANEKTRMSALGQAYVKPPELVRSDERWGWTLSPQGWLLVFQRPVDATESLTVMEVRAVRPLSDGSPDWDGRGKLVRTMELDMPPEYDAMMRTMTRTRTEEP